MVWVKQLNPQHEQGYAAVIMRASCDRSAPIMPVRFELAHG